MLVRGIIINNKLIFCFSTFFTGENQVKSKTLTELLSIYKVLRSRIKDLNVGAVRDKKYDSPMANENWLYQAIKSNISPQKKKQLILTQIGYLRINIFTEYFERVNQLREKNELNAAVELMNKHAEIASIFISKKKQPALIKRLKGLVSIKNIDRIEYLQKWRTAYEKWRKQESIQRTIDEKKQLKEFDQLKMFFLELYTFSFSVDNFPPLRYRRSDH